MVSAGLLILRLVIGLTIAAHGAQKLLGWWGGPTMAGATGMMRGLNVKPARFWAYALAATETFGGLLVAIGLLTPVAALMVFGAMLAAAILVHLPNGFFNGKGGIEYPLTLAVVMFALASIGPGRYSLDAILGIDLVSPAVFTVTLLVVLAGVVAALVSRHVIAAPGRAGAARAR